MALKPYKYCCTAKYLFDKVCNCFEGFQFSGFFPFSVVTVRILTAKNEYAVELTADAWGVLLVSIDDFPERIFNKFGGVYRLRIDDAVFGEEEYSELQFSVIDCDDTGIKIIEQEVTEDFDAKLRIADNEVYRITHDGFYRSWQ